MSLISDVNEEVNNLDQSPKKLKQFSLLMFLISSAGLIYFYFEPHGFWIGFFFVFFVVFFIGLFKPLFVKKTHKIWMKLAFIMGWFVSRFLLSLIYFFVVTPIGLITRIFGKKFIETGFGRNENSYWKKRVNPKIDYTKMS
ncbi:MAG: hypothetical protein D8M58_16760 [Calditrichaeota bacterium]|nr:MAG: hypothetical protein DWQ03_11890 [Calditrichota bacterium]MBL1207058.1 hypothetical protein [Calditrichota bacterium]NOG46887.1 hypothetical protein [Calditrichota bacterium]